MLHRFYTYFSCSQSNYWSCFTFARAAFTCLQYFLFSDLPKTEATDDDNWEEMPKIKEVAEGPYYDQFDYNVTRNYTVIAGTPAELLCRIKLKPPDGNKTVG